MVARTGSTDHRHGGFSPQLEGQEARRQFHISLSLVVMLSIGIVSAGVAVGGHPLSAKRDIVASRAPVTVMHAETNAVGARPI